MRRASLPLLLLVACLAMAAPSSALADDCPGADLTPMAANLGQVSAATLCLLNAQRSAAGLNPLTEQGDLTSASQAYSELMVSAHFFAHVSPDGSQLSDRLTTSGYLGAPGSWIVGENIAWGESYLATPREIMQAWMNSEKHKENILSPAYQQVGVGIALGVPSSDNAGATYTTDFGTRHPDGAPPAAATQGTLTVGASSGSPGNSAVRAGARATPKTRAPHRSTHVRARRLCRASMTGWTVRSAKTKRTPSRRCGARVPRRRG